MCFCFYQYPAELRNLSFLFPNTPKQKKVASNSNWCFSALNIDIILRRLWTFNKANRSKSKQVWYSAQHHYSRCKWDGELYFCEDIHFCARYVQMDQSDQCQLIVLWAWSITSFSMLIKCQRSCVKGLTRSLPEREQISFGYYIQYLHYSEAHSLRITLWEDGS